MLNLLGSDPLAFALLAAALVMALTVHEFAHAAVADRFGDKLPRSMGRVTLNPAKHLDPVGTLLLVLVGFGFAKPVPVNGEKLGRWPMMWVAAAGPISNILLALMTALLLRALPPELLLSGDGIGTLATAMMYFLSVNITLAVFNLLPIPLLDGSRIIGAIVPHMGRALAELERTPYASLGIMAFLILFREPIGNLIRVVQRAVFALILH